MAVIDTSRAHIAPGTFTNAVAKLTSAISAYLEVRATRSALSQLSDRELEDIGLNRGDIERIGIHH